MIGKLPNYIQNRSLDVILYLIGMGFKFVMVIALLTILMLDMVVTPLILTLPALLMWDLLAEPYNYLAVTLVSLPAIYLDVLIRTSVEDDLWPVGPGERMFLNDCQKDE